VKFVRVFAALLLAAFPAWGLALFGGDFAENQAPPPNGSPWAYVARMGTSEATGVYLGKRFVLTANHINLLSPVLVNGVNYQRDTAFAPRQIGGDDLKLIRILGDPALPGLPLIGSADNELARRCTVIAWGDGTGAAIAGRGWTRNSLRVQRWGLNTTLPQIYPKSGGERLVTAFNANLGRNECSLLLGDSGGALFIKFNGVWKLVGLAVDADNINEAYYDRDPNTAGNQPDRDYYVPIKKHRAEIRQVINAAAP
jgi:hypothetical protein